MRLMTEEEFKIDEPGSKENREKQTLAKQLRKAKAIEHMILCALITKKSDLDVDNIFQIFKDDTKVCCLTYTLPCKNPHCTTCNMVSMNRKEADTILSQVGKIQSVKLVNKVMNGLGDDEAKELDDFIETLMKELKEKDDDDIQRTDDGRETE